MKRTPLLSCNHIIAVLGLAIVLPAGCMSTDISKDYDVPVMVESSKVTYARPREAIPVQVRVAGADQVYRWANRVVGSSFVSGTSHSNIKIGEALREASPVVWNKYLDVRTDGAEKLTAIEMEVTDVSGEMVVDFHGDGGSAVNSGGLTITLRAQVINPGGQVVETFSSTKRYTMVPTSDTTKWTEKHRAPGNLLVQAFNEILPQFFSSQKVLATLSAAKEQYAAVQRPTGAAAQAGDVRPIGKYFAVVIGIGKFQNVGKGGLTNLAYADDDAKAFSNALKKQGWGEGRVKLLVNEEATKRNVEVALESWLTKAGPDDVILLYWSGHGFPDPDDPEKVYFACHDTDVSIPATGLRMDRVRIMLEERKARNVLVFADTCHAGKLITRGEKGVNIGSFVDKMDKEKAIPKGWIFMVAAEADRAAIEHSSWSNGAFTHCLLEALAGKADGYQGVGPKDGVVTMLELRTYLSSVMPEETQKVLGVAKRPIITTSSGDSGIWNLDLKAK